MTYVRGMGYVKDRPLEPPEQEVMLCPRCDEEVTVIEDKRERSIECSQCGECLAAFDWDAEAERRAERDW